MDNENDWIFIDNDHDHDQLVIQFNKPLIDEKSNEEECHIKTKSSYASALLKQFEKNSDKQQSSIRTVKKQEKPLIKNNDKEDVMISYIESKPGSQFRNPRDKAGRNKVHKSRQRSSSPPKNSGNSLKIGCSFCSPQFSNRAERRRILRQQRSIVYWKDYDY